MTREEKAIMYFKVMRKIICEDHLNICPKDSIAHKATLAEKDFYDTAIEALEQKPNKWVPVSERLPKPYTWVYVTCHSLVDDRPNWVVDTIYDPSMSRFSISDWGNIPILNVKDAEVIAWMEWIEPEPYKAESEDKNDC